MATDRIAREVRVMDKARELVFVAGHASGEGIRDGRRHVSGIEVRVGGGGSQARICKFLHAVSNALAMFVSEDAARQL